MSTDSPNSDAPAEVSSPERRTGARRAVDTSAMIHLIKVGSKIRGHILDLSPGGCRIRTTDRFPLGIYTRVETEFRLQGQTVLVGGVVQAVYERDQIGIRFLDVSQRKRDQLVELIEELGEATCKQEASAETPEEGRLNGAGPADVATHDTGHSSTGPSRAPGA
jgi:hypothetical protein